MPNQIKMNSCTRHIDAYFDHHDDYDNNLRELLINDDLLAFDDSDYDDPNPTILINLLLIRLCLIDLERADDDAFRPYLNELHIRLDLCPMHSIDLDICIDDCDTECAQLRASYEIYDNMTRPA